MNNLENLISDIEISMIENVIFDLDEESEIIYNSAIKKIEEALEELKKLKLSI